MTLMRRPEPAADRKADAPSISAGAIPVISHTRHRKPGALAGMKPSGTCMALIRVHEGLRLIPYRCPAGHPTIGYGHRLTPAEEADGRFSRGISAAAAEELLARDVGLAAAAVRSMVRVALTQGQFDALVSLVFNVGAARVAGYRLIARLNGGDIEGAAEEFLDIDKARGADGRLVRLPGLTRRRQDEYALFLGHG